MNIMQNDPDLKKVCEKNRMWQVVMSCLTVKRKKVWWGPVRKDGKTDVCMKGVKVGKIVWFNSSRATRLFFGHLPQI